MNTEQLKFFIIAAKHLNFSEAAKELYVTQPAISHQISSLEKELHTELFIRSTRKIQLTKSGELFLADAKRMLDLEELAKEKVKSAENSNDLSLDIAYLLAPCREFLPKVLTLFQNKYPHIKVNLHRMDGFKIRESIKKSDMDIFFLLKKDVNKSTMNYKHLFTDTYSVICHQSHPCVSVSKIDYDKLVSETFFMLNPEIGPFISQDVAHILHLLNLNFKSVKYLDSMEEIIFMVESGMGITLLPSRNKIVSSSFVAYLPLEGPHAKVDFAFAWEKNNTNPAIELLLEML